MEIHDKHLTLVYTVNDPRKYRSVLERLTAQMKAPDGEPWAITAFSLEHEIHRLSLIEQAVEARDLDLIEEIIGLVNVDEIPNLDALRNRRGIFEA